MPLARQALHVAGEQIHLAVWPTVHEMHQIASRHYAFEGRCFVLVAGLAMRVKALPAEFGPSPSLANKPESYLLRGGSAIIGPNGRYVVEPCFDEEKTIIAQLDLTAVDEERMTLDVAGHYSRPDIFDLQVHQGHRHWHFHSRVPRQDFRPFRQTSPASRASQPRLHQPANRCAPTGPAR